MLEFQVTNGQGLWRTDKNIVSADTTDLKAQFELTAEQAGQYVDSTLTIDDVLSMKTE